MKEHNTTQLTTETTCNKTQKLRNCVQCLNGMKSSALTILCLVMVAASPLKLTPTKDKPLAETDRPIYMDEQNVLLHYISDRLQDLFGHPLKDVNSHALEKSRRGTYNHRLLANTSSSSSSSSSSGRRRRRGAAAAAVRRRLPMTISTSKHPVLRGKQPQFQNWRIPGLL